MTDRVPLPTFLYVGMPKAASSWLFEALRQHPDVFIPIAKDVQFFDYNYHRGMAWYRKFFEPGAGKSAIGELSHDYYVIDGALERIRKDLPGVKLIICLREPGDFAVSSFNYRRMHDLDRRIAFDDYVRSPSARCYLQHKDALKKMYDLFEPENIKVIFFDQIKSSPQSLLQEIYEFIGADADFRPAVIERKVNAAQQPRLLALTRLASATALAMRGLGMANIVGTIRRLTVFGKLLYKPVSTTSQDRSDAVSELRAECRADYAAIEALIGMPLPQSWYGKH